MTTPAFFVPGTRRIQDAWTDWDAVQAFIMGELLCRVAVNRAPYPFTSVVPYEFDGSAFMMLFPRAGRLAEALIAEPHCSIAIDQSLRDFKERRALDPSTAHHSIVARCDVELTEVNLEPAEGERRSREVFVARAVVQKLYGHRWNIDPTTES